MKKIISALLIFTLLLGCVFMLSSCDKDKDDKKDKTEEKGQLSGTYVYTETVGDYSYELSYKFVGDKVTATMKMGTEVETQEATYVINEAGDTITFTTVEDGESSSFDCDFEKGDGYIMINDDKFVKQ